MNTKLHFILNNNLQFIRYTDHVPRVGAEIRLTADEFYKVIRVVWCYDEGQDWDRANIEIIRVLDDE